MNVDIRFAEPDDEDGIAELFMKTWQISLKHMLPDGFIERFQLATQKQKYAERIHDPEWILMIAKSGDRIVGMIGARNNDSEPLFYQKQIKSLYVDPDYQRLRIGTKLLQAVFAEMTKQGAESVMLWCLSANYAACSFYAKHGGERLEEMPLPAEYAAAPHVIYAWKCIK